MKRTALDNIFHAIGWGVWAYRYQRNKPHGVRATRYVAAMCAGMGAHLILTRGHCWRLPWLSPAAWLRWIHLRRTARHVT